MTEYLEDRIKKLEEWKDTKFLGLDEYCIQDLQKRMGILERRISADPHSTNTFRCPKCNIWSDLSNNPNVVLINKQVWEDIMWSVGALHRHTPLGSIYAMSRVSDLITLIKKVDPDWSPYKEFCPDG